MAFAPIGSETPRAREVLDRRARKKEVLDMLWALIAVLLILWLLGLIGSVGGGLIHLLLVLALIVFVFQLVSGRRAV